MLSITVQISSPPKPVKRICEEHNCTVTKQKGEYYTIETDDVMNFYWLGANMHLRLNNIDPLTLKPNRQ